jgi:hypothetical protein
MTSEHVREEESYQNKNKFLEKIFPLYRTYNGSTKLDG